MAERPNEKAGKRLEQRLDEQKTYSSADDILPLEEYVTLFSERYGQEKPFREMVHKYLGLSGLSKTGLTIGKHVRPSWYRRKTDEMIERYATKIRDDLVAAYEIRQDLKRIEMAAEQLKDHATEVIVTEDAKEGTETSYMQDKESLSQDKRSATQAYDQMLEEDKRRAQELEEEIKRKTDAKNLVKEKIKEHIAQSSFVSVGPSGEFKFDEQKVVERLEDLFLDEIISGIETEDGSGFLSDAKATFRDVISYWGDLDDLTELGDVDWVQSAIRSRSKGYRLPQYPYLVSAKYESKGRSSIDTALMLDTSNSMDKNSRFQVAQKTALAMNALMRQLNPKNETYLGHFNSGVWDISAADLMKRVRPDGWTYTHQALDWLISKLQDRGPSMAYLITDGEPAGFSDAIDTTIKTAMRFQEHPYISLRIFLIDGDANTEDNVRRIGQAAGPRTKVIPVKNYELGSGVIRDVSQCIREMYDIGEF